MSVEEYLHTTFDGADREYLDGEVVERNMGNKSHSRVQARLINWFMVREDRTGLFTAPEMRHHVTASRYRIPDVPSVVLLYRWRVFENRVLRAGDKNELGIINEPNSLS